MSFTLCYVKRYFVLFKKKKCSFNVFYFFFYIDLKLIMECVSFLKKRWCLPVSYTMYTRLHKPSHFLWKFWQQGDLYSCSPRFRSKASQNFWYSIQAYITEVQKTYKSPWDLLKALHTLNWKEYILLIL